MPADPRRWPALPFTAWRDTCETLHLWTQVVGKVRLACVPWTNHSWHVPFYVTPHGLTTSLMHRHGRGVEIRFDFRRHRLIIETSDGGEGGLPLRPQTVAEFHRSFIAELERMGIATPISPQPSELADAIPFHEDHAHGAYDADAVERFQAILVSTHSTLATFRARFLGKTSPTHFFWGSFDLALTRFSGRAAPPHPGGIPNLADWIAREAYSHEVSSCGFWPGNAARPEPLFYSYAYPEPPGFSTAQVGPAAASYDAALHEFVLPYEAVRQSASPEADLLEFLQTTYEAAANAGRWDRAALERDTPPREVFG